MLYLFGDYFYTLLFLFKHVFDFLITDTLLVTGINKINFYVVAIHESYVFLVSALNKKNWLIVLFAMYSFRFRVYSIIGKCYLWEHFEYKY